MRAMCRRGACYFVPGSVQPRFARTCSMGREEDSSFHPMSSAVPSLLSARELSLSYGQQRVLDGATLAVSAGEKIGLVGRNGCGKTSLLKMLTGEQEPDSGDI